MGKWRVFSIALIAIVCADTVFTMANTEKESSKTSIFIHSVSQETRVNSSSLPVYPLKSFSTLSGASAYGINLSDSTLISIPDVDIPGTWNNIGNVSSNSYFAGDFAGNDFTQLYVINNDSKQLFSMDTTTGNVVLIGSCVPEAGHTWTGMSWDVTTAVMYACSTDGYNSSIYTLDMESGTATLIGSSNSTRLIDIAVNSKGEMYAVDVGSDELLSIDKTTGAAAVVGSLGVDANYAQGLDFEEEFGVLYWAAYTTGGQLRTIDTGTGASTLIGDFPDGDEVDCFAFATGGVFGETLPYCEGFETTWPPEGWTLYQEGTDGSWQQIADAYEGSYSAFHNDTSGTCNNWLVSPPVIIPESGTATLSFWEKNRWMSVYLYSGVLVSTGSGDPADGEFTEIYESDSALNAWTEKEIDLFAYAGETIYIAFNYQGNFDHEWWVDEFCVLSTAGDINGSGEVDISDVILCLRISIGLPVTIDDVEYNAPDYTPAILAAADMNGDDTVTITDVILILREAIGLEP